MSEGPKSALGPRLQPPVFPFFSCQESFLTPMLLRHPGLHPLPAQSLSFSSLFAPLHALQHVSSCSWRPRLLSVPNGLLQNLLPWTTGAVATTLSVTEVASALVESVLSLWGQTLNNPGDYNPGGHSDPGASEGSWLSVRWTGELLNY